MTYKFRFNGKILKGQAASSPRSAESMRKRLSGGKVGHIEVIAIPTNR